MILHRIVITAGATLAAGALFGSARPAQAATADRYWAYFVASDTSWQYSQRGPATQYPVDGQVQGWRFAVQADGARNVATPRRTPDFASLCATTGPVSGRLRVGVVLDFGTRSDAPADEIPPAGPVTGCVTVPDGATGLAVLDAAAGTAGVRIGTGSDAGLVCGIAGYPKAGCAITVDTRPTQPPASTSHPSTSPSQQPDSGVATPLRPSATGHPSVQQTTTAGPAAVSPDPAASAPSALAGGYAPLGSGPSPAGTPVSGAAASVAGASSPLGSTLTLTGLRAQEKRRSLPASAVIGGVAVVAVAGGTALRLRRGRRSSQ